MKTPSDHLFRIIHSMTAAEKRYLKRHYASSTSHLTILFDFINNMNSYSEKVVKGHFSESNIRKNLKVYKVQLNDLILKSLVSYHAKKNTRSIIRQGMEETSILLQKELPYLALGKIEKLIKLCKKNDESSLLLSVLNMKIETCSLLDLHEEVEESYHLINELCEIFKREKKLRQILADLEDKRVHSQTPIGETECSFYRDLLDGDTLKDQNSNLLSYLTRKIRSDIYGVIFREKDRETQENLELLQLFEDDYFKFEYQVFAHFELLLSLASDCIDVDDSDGFEKKLLKIDELIADHSMLSIKLPKVYHLKLKYYYGLQDSTKIKEMLSDSFIDDRISGMKDGIQSDIYSLMYVMLYYKRINENKKGDHLFGEIRQIDLNENLEAFIQILELIDHFRSNSYSVVKYLLAAYNRKVKRGTQFPKFVILFNELLKNLIKSPIENRSELVIGFEEVISTLKPDKIHSLWNTYQLSDWLDLLKESDPSYSEKTQKNSSSSQNQKSQRS